MNSVFGPATPDYSPILTFTSEPFVGKVYPADDEGDHRVTISRTGAAGPFREGVRTDFATASADCYAGVREAQEFDAMPW